MTKAYRLHRRGMLSRYLIAAALACAFALPAAAESAHDNRDTKIEEAHDTPPENLPANAGDRGLANRVPKRSDKPDTRGVQLEEAHDTPPPAGAGASTRGENIDEAHRTSPENTPARTDGLR